MYNRYIRNDRGVYTRIPQEEPVPPAAPAAAPPQSAPAEPHAPPPPPDAPPHRPAPSPPKSGPQITDGLTGILRHALDHLRLEQVDTGDLLLLGLLFLLFREDADEELLVALGLLLIL